MIPAVISPAMTELQNQDSRLVMSDKAQKREIEELTAQGSQPNADDNESLIAKVLANPDSFPTDSDNAAKIKTAWQKRAAIDAARQSLKPKLAKAKYEAGSAILKSPEVQKQHGDLMKRIVPPLAEIAKAWAELFAMSRELRDREIGFRHGICECMPLDLLGVPNQFSPLASYLQSAVKAGYISAGSVPKELRGA
jgi:hypothetical protein